MSKQVIAKSVWFMQGVSSQRELILAAKSVLPKDVVVIASHRDNRKEIANIADVFIQSEKRMCISDERKWVLNIIKSHNVVAIHAGMNGKRIERHRSEIEAMGVKLVTGAKDQAIFEMADDKVRFANFMASSGLPSTPSILVHEPNALAHLIDSKPFGDVEMCLKPVKGIYGMGFWHFSDDFDSYECFRDPSSRKTNTDVMLNALRRSMDFEPLVLMPFLSGVESSVDMVVDDGNVLVAIARTKTELGQRIEMEGESIELAKRCAKEMGADGLINVQTKLGADGKMYILESNLRPSGGVCFGKDSGVNIADYFALFLFGDKGLLDKKLSTLEFCPILVRVDSSGFKI